MDDSDELNNLNLSLRSLMPFCNWAIDTEQDALPMRVVEYLKLVGIIAAHAILRGKRGRTDRISREYSIACD